MRLTVNGGFQRSERSEILSFDVFGQLVWRVKAESKSCTYSSDEEPVESGVLLQNGVPLLTGAATLVAGAFRPVYSQDVYVVLTTTSRFGNSGGVLQWVRAFQPERDLYGRDLFKALKLLKKEGVPPEYREAFEREWVRERSIIEQEVTDLRGLLEG